MAKFTNAFEILALANDTRERMANEIFAYETVSKLIADKSAKGEVSTIIRQDKPYTLENTYYAQGVEKKLKAAGYVVTWVDDIVAVKIPTHIDPLKVPYKALKISWAAAKKKKTNSP